ncbi:hypothetical protein [uncultured Tenacibaculum sp.]|uniref:hypothetical protein n=1 Tax=uncultured Tenacibaculum sp. TaxID=174713 RepID=UPI00260F51F2|nr:hypothetical protein [uncultured Tenacibaculum sp.]
MKFFEFTNATFQWYVNVYLEDYGDIISPINNNQWLREEVTPLKMRLIDSFKDLSVWKGETPFLDVLSWYTDITTGDDEPKKGVTKIISKKVKDVLEKFRLPDCRFYPLVIESKDLKIINKDYFLFHMKAEKSTTVGDDIIDYQKCTFEEVTQDIEGNKSVVNIFPEGTIKTSKDMYAKKDTLGTYIFKYRDKELLRKNKVRFQNKVYKHNYDVLWGYSEVLYVSEEVVKALNSVGVTNANFYEIKENIIRPFEYEQMKNDGII